ncbi:hypothetical protein CDAR_491801 [Caerostris darwini]|uniref:Uncharacterized protein n=1 Tax=Caerostris darwini TaxID=1538125 RepID=A0AAV4N1D3_9ARAC|nr:hypothetical protein CDAR_491801 [Caerostris darwini]
MSNSRVHNKSWEEGNGNLGANLSRNPWRIANIEQLSPINNGYEREFPWHASSSGQGEDGSFGHLDRARSKTRFSNGGGREK